MERLRCKTIVHITVNRLRQMNTSSILIGEEGERKREREGRGSMGRRKGTEFIRG